MVGSKYAESVENVNDDEAVGFKMADFSLSHVGCWAEEPERELLVKVNIEEYAPQIRDKVAWWLGTLDASQAE